MEAAKFLAAGLAIAVGVIGPGIGIGILGAGGPERDEKRIDFFEKSRLLYRLLTRRDRSA